MEHANMNSERHRKTPIPILVRIAICDLRSMRMGIETTAPRQTSSGVFAFYLLITSVMASRTGPVQNVKFSTALEIGKSGKHFAVSIISIVPLHDAG